MNILDSTGMGRSKEKRKVEPFTQGGASSLVSHKLLGTAGPSLQDCWLGEVKARDALCLAKLKAGF